MKLDVKDYEDLMDRLDTECWQCHGRGKVALEDCDVCYGTGYQPTRVGIKLLGFLRRQKKQIETEKI